MKKVYKIIFSTIFLSLMAFLTISLYNNSKCYEKLVRNITVIDNEEPVYIDHMYEPWHYRYVGKDVAKVIYEKNITYEEYYATYILKG